MVGEEAQGAGPGAPVPGLARSLRARFARLRGEEPEVPLARGAGGEPGVPSSESARRGELGAGAGPGEDLILARERFTNRVARFLTLAGSRREALLPGLLEDVEVFRSWGAGGPLLDAALALEGGGEAGDEGREALLEAMLGPLVLREASRRLEGAAGSERERLSRLIVRSAGLGGRER